MSDTAAVTPAKQTLKSFGAPQAIAIVGASQPGGNYYGAKLIGNVVGAGTSARVYPVNPRLDGQELMGHRAYASLSALPEVPDLVIFATRTNIVLAGLEEAAALGVPTSVIITSAEASEQAAFDAEVRALALRSGMRIIGPNSMGLMNGPANLNASFASGLGGRIPTGQIAFLSQSGAVISAMLQKDQNTNIGYSWLVSTGNEAATRVEDLFEAVVDDPDTGVIVLFIEGVTSGTTFRRAALRARLAGKPVVLLKAGISAAGRTAVQSHTGRMAGTREVFGAVAAESGIVTAESFQDMFRMSRALRDALPHLSKPSGRRAAVLSNSGGLTTVSADHLDLHGWQLPAFTPDVQAAVNAAAGKTGVNNPADVPGSWANNPLMANVLREIAGQEDLDAIFVMSGAGGGQARNVTRELLKVIPGLRQQVYVSWIGASPDMYQDFEDAGLTLYSDPLDAVRAAETVARLSHAWADPEAARALLAALPAQTPDAPVETDDQEVVWTADEVLHSASGFGLRQAPGQSLPGLDAAQTIRAAGEVGFPVVLKINAASLSHKTEVGGVRTGLTSDAEVAAAIRDFQKIAADTGAADMGVMIQSMVSGIEVLVGIKRDPSFGPILFVGLGGIFAELQAGLTGIPLPTTRAEIAARLKSATTLTHLLDGYRGMKGGDTSALVDAIDAIGRWAQSLGPALQEADFNPIFVTPTGVFAVDGRAVLRGS